MNIPRLTFPSFTVALPLGLEQKPLEDQVEQLKQIAAERQQMLIAQHYLNGFEINRRLAAEVQNEQLQRRSVERNDAADERIKKLEEVLNFQNQEKLLIQLNDENALLHKEIKQMEVQHRQEWKAFIGQKAKKMENSIIKIKLTIKVLENAIKQAKDTEEIVKESRIFLAEDFDKQNPTPKQAAFIQKYTRYLKTYPGSAKVFETSDHELMIMKAESAFAHTCTLIIQEFCLQPVAATNWKDASKHPEYPDLVDKNEDFQEILKMFANDPITKLKMLNGALKIRKNEMESFHLECFKSFSAQVHTDPINCGISHIQSLIPYLLKHKGIEEHLDEDNLKLLFKRYSAIAQAVESLLIDLKKKFEETSPKASKKPPKAAKPSKAIVMNRPPEAPMQLFNAASFELDKNIEQKPLEVQAQYLHQTLANQQQMMVALQFINGVEMNRRIAVEAQGKQLQLRSAENGAAANHRIKLLEDPSNFQLLKDQEGLLETENSLLKKEIVFMAAMHQENLRTLVSCQAAKVENVALKIKFILDGFKTYNEPIKEVAEMLKEIRLHQTNRIDPKNATPEQVDFIKRWLGFIKFYNLYMPIGGIKQEMLNAEQEYDANDFYGALIRTKCLEPLGKFNREGKHPEYLRLSTEKPLVCLEDNQEMQKLLALFVEEPVTHLKISNAALTLFKNEMQEFHLECVKRLPKIVYDRFISPCMRQIDMYRSCIVEAKKAILAQRTPDHATQAIIAEDSFIKRTELIKAQLDQVYTEIEESFAEFRNS